MGSGEMLWLNNKPRVSQIGCRAFSLADGQWSGKFSLVGKRIWAVIGPQAGQARKAQFWLASRLGRQRKAQFWLAHRLNRKGKLNSDWPASWTDKRKLNSDWLGQISYLELRAGGLCWVDQGCLLEQQQLVVSEISHNLSQPIQPVGLVAEWVSAVDLPFLQVVTKIQCIGS